MDFDNWEHEKEINEFYNNIQEILVERGERWIYLIRLIESNINTFSSIKSQNINSRWPTVRNASIPLDVSMGEFTYGVQDS